MQFDTHFDIAPTIFQKGYFPGAPGNCHRTARTKFVHDEEFTGITLQKHEVNKSFLKKCFLCCQNREEMFPKTGIAKNGKGLYFESTVDLIPIVPVGTWFCKCPLYGTSPRVPSTIRIVVLTFKILEMAIYVFVFE